MKRDTIRGSKTAVCRQRPRPYVTPLPFPERPLAVELRDHSFARRPCPAVRAYRPCQYIRCRAKRSPWRRHQGGERVSRKCPPIYAGHAAVRRSPLSFRAIRPSVQPRVNPACLRGHPRRLAIPSESEALEQRSRRRSHLACHWTRADRPLQRIVSVPGSPAPGGSVAGRTLLT